MKWHDRYHTILAVLSLCLAAFLIFQNLSKPAIRIWDEAIYADNTLDMYSYGDPVVMKRNGELTLYNTKPPLVIWLQTLSMHLFGVNEFAIRFPSALAGVLTCLLVLGFSAKTLKDIRIGIVAVLVLSTTQGFVTDHVTKTGDLDAVLVFWTTLYTFLFLHLLIRRPENETRYIGWTGASLAGAFLTKGIAGFVPAAGLFVCVWIAGQAHRIFRQWRTWMIAGIVLSVCLSYYVLRESLARGYLARVYASEFSRFHTDIMSWHVHPWYYYFRNWYDLDFFTPYVWWLPVAALAGLISKRLRQPVRLMVIQVLVFIGILSIARVKLMWYDAPAYPLLAVICAAGLMVLWDEVWKRAGIHSHVQNILWGCLLVLLFFIPVRTIYLKNSGLQLSVDDLEREGFFIRQLHREAPDIRQYKVLMPVATHAHYTQIDFYVNAYNRYKGYRITILPDSTLVRAGDTIVCCQEKYLSWLEATFHPEDLREKLIGCRVMRINEK